MKIYPNNHKRHIRNPEKWIGKYVRHMANWQEFQWLITLDDNATDDYFVDEWNGCLYRACDQGYYGDTFETLEEATAAGYDPCYCYSEAGFYQMWQRANRKAA